ncbi:hypothetical protein E2562_037677 [Oryza meyeriana var. granulata]|uniref:Uncharacterized protein n=1 Tax=Oryza meyeriana var. granulata TaxID=110450 RepID=A0A6G1BQ42_9ORYZ|nr:hypothetical protein E2562_037677 [Oryza meyeriana var. granulata]
MEDHYFATIFYRLRSILSKGKDIRVGFSQLKLHFMFQMFKKPCKIGYKYLEDGTKVRVARGMNASGAVIPRPEILKERRKPRPTSPGPKDTPIELVLEKTYDAKAGIGMPDL